MDRSSMRQAIRSRFWSSVDPQNQQLLPEQELIVSTRHFSPTRDIVVEETIPLAIGRRHKMERNFDFVSDRGIVVRARIRVHPSALFQVKETQLILELLRAMPSSKRNSGAYEMVYRSERMELGGLLLQGKPAWYMFKNIVEGDYSLQAGFIVDCYESAETGKWRCTIVIGLEEWPVTDQP